MRSVEPLVRGTSTLELRPADLHLVAADVASRVVAPTADAVSDDERDRIAAEEPLSLLRVLGPEGRDGADAGRIAGDLIREMVAEGRFLPVGRVFAIHELVQGDHRQIGVVGAVPVAHCEQGLVRPHEATRRRHEQTLGAFLDAAGMDVSPVTLTYRARSDVDAIVSSVTDAEPDLEFAGWRQVCHRVWLVRDGATSAQLRRAFAAVGQVTIVDGHHRIAAAVRRATIDGRPPATFLATLVPDRDVRIVGYDRCVAAQDLDPNDLLSRLTDVVTITALDALPQRPRDRHELHLFADRRWYTLRFRTPPHDVPDGLAPVLLQERVLGPLLGVADARADERLDYMPGILPLQEVAARCEAHGELAFVLPPVSVDDLQRVTARGRLLPPKATYNDPKPDPGVFLRLRPRQDELPAIP